MWWPRIVVMALVGVVSLALVMPAVDQHTNQAASPEGQLSSMKASASGVQPDEDEEEEPAVAARLTEATAAEAAAPAAAPDDCRALTRRPGTFTAWNPGGPKRVGIQAGHWLTREAPDELARLRNQTGTSAGGYTEWEVNLDIARKTAALLADVGVEAAVLPTTLPACYLAHAFVSVHADGDLSGALNGFKVARARGSMIPTADDALVSALNQQYAAATSLPRDDAHISGRMLNYYAFNVRRQPQAIAPNVPGAIIETGFLTNASDRHFLTQRADRVAAGIANGVLQYLGMRERVPVG